MKDGFIKVAAASPVIKVADTVNNTEAIISCMCRADELGVKILVLPELCITGCTCGDLLNHRVLLDGAKEAVNLICDATYDLDLLVFVGLPIEVGTRIFSCAAAIYKGQLIGLVPSQSAGAQAKNIAIGQMHSAIMSPDILFEHASIPGLKIAVELGEDVGVPASPSSRHAVSGATVIVRMVSFPETIDSTALNELCLRADSSRLSCGMILAAPGRGESTTDNSYSGLCVVAENGRILAEDEDNEQIAVSELDIQQLVNLRRSSGLFEGSDAAPHYPVYFGRGYSKTELTRFVSKHPHLPDCPEALPAYCRRLLDIQVNGLCKRMLQSGLDHCVVGISGGVDSTLAVMVSAMAVEKLGLPRENVVACTLPCFGTTSRTKNNAVTVAEQWGCEVRVINISNSVNAHFDEIGHARDDYSIAFENAQARMRTMVLLDIANKVNGLDVGTEDLSEYIDGWCTYNGDHTSNYDVNLGLTKTQVRAVVAHIAASTENSVLKAALYDVLDCPVTPELLPVHDDLIEQKSEDAVGSYALQDFFTWNILVSGFTPSKTFRLAKQAYGEEFSDEELIRWLKSWCKRLFSQQFKRSCLMDGPAVDRFTVSPRAGLHMPSDAEAALFLAELEKLEEDPDFLGDYREY